MITETDYFSFEDEGLMDEIKNSGMWELIDTTKTDLTKMKEEIAAQKAAQEEKKSLAKKLLALNTMSVEEIRKLTGLTIREMNKILKEIGE